MHTTTSSKSEPSSARKPTPPAASAPAPTSAAAPAFKPVQPKQPRDLRLVLGVSAAAVVVVGLVLFLLLRTKTEVPRLNAPTTAILKYMNTSAFDALPFGKRLDYYKALNGREPEIKQLHKDQKITDEEFRSAKEGVWVAEQYNHAQKYSAMNNRQRQEYLNKMFDKKEQKDIKEEAKPEDPTAIHRDKTREDDLIATWPDLDRARWEEFHQAYKTVKEAHEKDVPATMPATRPTASVDNTVAVKAGKHKHAGDK